MIRFLLILCSFVIFSLQAVVDHLISASPGIIHGAILIGHHIPYFQKLIAPHKPDLKNEQRVRTLLKCLHYPAAQNLEIRSLPTHIELKEAAFIIGNVLIINETSLDDYTDEELYDALHEALSILKTAHFLKLIAASFLIPVATVSFSHLMKNAVLPLLPHYAQKIYTYINPLMTCVLTYKALKVYVTYENENLQHQLSLNTF